VMSEDKPESGVDGNRLERVPSRASARGSSPGGRQRCRHCSPRPRCATSSAPAWRSNSPRPDRDLHQPPTPASPRCSRHDRRRPVRMGTASAGAGPRRSNTLRRLMVRLGSDGGEGCGAKRRGERQRRAQAFEDRAPGQRQFGGTGRYFRFAPGAASAWRWTASASRSRTATATKGLFYVRYADPRCRQEQEVRGACSTASSNFSTRTSRAGRAVPDPGDRQRARDPGGGAVEKPARWTTPRPRSASCRCSTSSWSERGARRDGAAAALSGFRFASLGSGSEGNALIAEVARRRQRDAA